MFLSGVFFSKEVTGFTSGFLIFVPDAICLASVFNFKMYRLSTSPRRRVNDLAPLWDYRRSVFPKDTTMHCPIKKRTENRQLCGCQRALLSTELPASWDNSILFSKDTKQRDMVNAQRGTN